MRMNGGSGSLAELVTDMLNLGLSAMGLERHYFWYVADLIVLVSQAFLLATGLSVIGQQYPIDRHPLNPNQEP